MPSLMVPARWRARLAHARFERAEQDSTTIRRSTPRFQWFAGLALLLLVGEAIISDRRGGWFGGERRRRTAASEIRGDLESGEQEGRQAA